MGGRHKKAGCVSGSADAWLFSKERWVVRFFLSVREIPCLHYAIQKMQITPHNQRGCWSDHQFASSLYKVWAALGHCANLSGDAHKNSALMAAAKAVLVRAVSDCSVLAFLRILWIYTNHSFQSKGSSSLSPYWIILAHKDGKALKVVVQISIVCDFLFCVNCLMNHFVTFSSTHTFFFFWAALRQSAILFGGDVQENSALSSLLLRLCVAHRASASISLANLIP